ncbi:Ferredoxin, 2Fe-2S [Novipirellula artificiosorum]|uniref:Ferredoxin, 2Fe-2S n=2 Tax=Novipirellula artificiosorum TaxID=2528016 RepID=A0A5C6DDX1_9BACT|nr:Ferredoxin, 2Fe-2S [Novipirellula artificiosorum]
MVESWKYLKRRLKELKLEKRGGVVRVKISCVDICRGGPILAIMPDGIWYGGCTPAVIDRILMEHLANGKPVEEYVIASKSL